MPVDLSKAVNLDRFRAMTAHRVRRALDFLDSWWSFEMAINWRHIFRTNGVL
jgi:hypothetical protein